MSLSRILTEVACKRYPKIQADLEEPTLQILAHLRYPREKVTRSSQDAENNSINISFYLFRKKRYENQSFHGGRSQATLCF